MKLYELQSPGEILELDRELDKLMRPFGLDVVLTKHFKERILGRDKSVTVDEVRAAFATMKQKYHERIMKAKKEGGMEAVLKDFGNDLNVAFLINNKDDLITKTIMRKDPRQFKTSNFDSEVLNVKAPTMGNRRPQAATRSNLRRGGRNQPRARTGMDRF